MVNKQWQGSQDMVNEVITDKSDDCGFILVFNFVILHQNRIVYVFLIATRGFEFFNQRLDRESTALLLLTLF